MARSLKGFEPGHRVRFKDNITTFSGARREPGQLATVVDILGDLLLVLVDGENTSESWYPHRFELAEPAKPAEPAHWPASRINEPSSLPTDGAVRKGLPIATGVIHYFPRALAYVARVSKTGNDKHNPGEPLHWSKEKSTDHLDCVARHLADAGKRGDANLRESGYLAWRALANLEIELEAAEARGEPW